MEHTLDQLKQRLELIKLLLGAVIAIPGAVTAVVQFLPCRDTIRF